VKKPAKPGKPSLWDMIIQVDDEARRIRMVQARLVEIGELKAPDPRQSRRAEIFEGLSKLLRLIETRQDEVRAVLRPRPAETDPAPEGADGTTSSDD
jgi:hypothetical protein